MALSLMHFTVEGSRTPKWAPPMNINTMSLFMIMSSSCLAFVVEINFQMTYY